MPHSITAGTIDDLQRRALELILEKGATANPSRGSNRELEAVTLELTNPQARLSRSQTRGRVFSAIGELAWYLAGSDSTNFISYYIPAYRDDDENGRINGAYGPRLFGSSPETAQVKEAIERLRRNPDSRRAALPILRPDDLSVEHKDVPCTCHMQFLLRNGALDLIVCMRSNDAFLGLTHDIFAFTMIQELAARSLDVEIGAYVHFTGSLHLYDKHADQVSRFLGEGWQSTQQQMPNMCERGDDPWLGVEAFLQAEQAIREGGDVDLAKLGLNSFWFDLAKLLELYALTKGGQEVEPSHVISELTSSCYDLYVKDRAER
jgi:thymidylate synthase